MNRKLATVLLTVLVLSLSLWGCADVNCHLTVHPNGSADIDLKIVLDSAAINFLHSVGLNPLAAIIEELEQEGYSVAAYEDGEKAGITANKHIAKISADSLDFPRSPEALEAALPHDGFVVQRGILKTRYLVETMVDLSTFSGPGLLPGLENYILDQASFQFILTLPVVPHEHNAHRTDDGGKTLIWQLKPGQANLIKLEVSHWNPQGLALLIATALSVMAGLIYLIRRGKKNRA